MSSMRSGLQLWSAAVCLEVLLEVGARADVIEALRAAASLPRAACVSADDAARLLPVRLSDVVAFPAELPAVVVAAHWAQSNYALSAEQRASHPINGEFEVRTSRSSAMDADRRRRRLSHLT